MMHILFYCIISHENFVLVSIISYEIEMTNIEADGFTWKQTYKVGIYYFH